MTFLFTFSTLIFDFPLRDTLHASRYTSNERQATCDEFALFWSFFVVFCSFYASLRLKRTVCRRLQIKVRPKGLHSFAFYILIFNFPPCLCVFVAKNPFNQRNQRLIKDLRTSNALYICKETFTGVMKTLQIKLFLQNKAKSPKVKLDVNKVLTKDYDQLDTWSIGTKQSQTNPNKAKLKKAKMNVSSILTKVYGNKPPIWAPKKQTQTNPISKAKKLNVQLNSVEVRNEIRVANHKRTLRPFSIAYSRPDWNYLAFSSHSAPSPVFMCIFGEKWYNALRVNFRI